MVRFTSKADINDHRFASNEVASGARVRELIGDNPRHYRFDDSFDELSAMAHNAAHSGLTKRQPDRAKPLHQRTLG